jgi:hypothetical protein
VMHRFPNSSPRCSPLSSLRPSWGNLQQTMLLDTTGLRKEVENLGKSMVSTDEPLIFGSAPPILTPHPCASKVEEFIWAITRITSWMGANAELF